DLPFIKKILTILFGWKHVQFFHLFSIWHWTWSNFQIKYFLSLSNSILRTMKKRIFYSLLFLFFLNSCTSKKDNHLFEVNPEFAAYVSAYTSGLVSTESNIKVILQTDILLEKNDDKSLKKEIISFSPSIKGKTYLIDNSTLEFHPEEKLEQGEIYTGKVDLTSVYPKIPKELKNFEFQFQAKKQDYTVSLEGIQDTPEGQGHYVFTGNIYTADFAKSAQIDDMLEASFDGKKMPVVWDHSYNQKNHRFTINGLK